MTSRDEEGLLNEFSLARGGATGVVPVKNLEAAVNALRAMGKVTIYPGESAFNLYDTWACPVTSSKTLAAIAGISFGSAGFDACHGRAAQARAGFLEGRLEAKCQPGLSVIVPPHRVRGLSQDAIHRQCKVLAIIKSHNGTGVGVQELKPGERGEIVLDHTPFYADAGGQVGDVGWLYADDHNTIVAEVEGCDLSRAGSARASRGRQAAHSSSATRSMPWSTTKSAAPPCATIPARICCMPRCARCWASM